MPIRRNILGYEGRYDVSDEGEVRSFLRASPHVLKPGYDHLGYPLVVLTGAGGRRRTRRIHILVAETFHGPRAAGMQVRHLNGNPSDCRASNLAWGTPSQNVDDQVKHGTHHFANVQGCPAGHPYDEVNTYVNRQGGRECRTCHRDRERTRRAARCR